MTARLTWQQLSQESLLLRTSCFIAFCLLQHEIGLITCEIKVRWAKLPTRFADWWPCLSFTPENTLRTAVMTVFTTSGASGTNTHTHTYWHERWRWLRPLKPSRPSSTPPKPTESAGEYRQHRGNSCGRPSLKSNSWRNKRTHLWIHPSRLKAGVFHSHSSGTAPDLTQWLQNRGALTS